MGRRQERSFVSSLRIDRRNTSEEQRPRKNKSSLKLAVFDLDYTVWQPEMHQLHGPPKLDHAESQKGLLENILKEARTSEEGNRPFESLTDRTEWVRSGPSPRARIL
jgi:hypothetical protein